MKFSISAPWSTVHEKFNFFYTPTRRITDFDRLWEAWNIFEMVINRSTANVEFLRKFVSIDILLHFSHPLPVDRGVKNMRQQPRPYQRRRGERKLFSLPKEPEKVREGTTTKGRGSGGGFCESGSDSPSSELSFEALDEAA
jgi:hypothetical protein